MGGKAVAFGEVALDELLAVAELAVALVVLDVDDVAAGGGGRQGVLDATE